MDCLRGALVQVSAVTQRREGEPVKVAVALGAFKRYVSTLGPQNVLR